MNLDELRPGDKYTITGSGAQRRRLLWEVQMIKLTRLFNKTKGSEPENRGEVLNTLQPIPVGPVEPKNPSTPE